MPPKLQIRQSLRIEVPTPEGPQELDGTILKLGDAEITVTLPETATVPPALATAAEVRIRVWDKLGAHQGVARLLRYMPPPVSALVLRPPRQYQTTQNRQYFRVATSLPLKLTILAASGADLAELDVPAVTSDVSAGGFGFETTLALTRDDRLRATIGFPRPGKGVAPESVTCRARVVRVIPLEPPAADRVLVGCEIEGLSERERDRLVQLLFDLQRTVR